MHSLSKSMALSSAVALVLAGCVTSGGHGGGVDPNEAILVQRLAAENCAVSDKLVLIDDVTVMNITDGSFETERAAHVGLYGFSTNMYYIKRTGQMACRFGDYHPSQILLDLGGNRNTRIKHRRALDMSVYQEIRKLRVQWDGYDETLTGTIREVGNGQTGTIAIQLPDAQGTCIGSFRHPPKSGYGAYWRITCPDERVVKGKFENEGIKLGAVGGSNADQNDTVTFVVGDFE